MLLFLFKLFYRDMHTLHIFRNLLIFCLELSPLPNFQIYAYLTCIYLTAALSLHSSFKPDIICNGILQGSQIQSVLFLVTFGRVFNFFFYHEKKNHCFSLSYVYLIQYIDVQQSNNVILLLVYYISYLIPHLPNIKPRL